MTIEWGYAGILLIAALVAAGIARTSWKRQAPGSRGLTALMLALIWWSVTYALFWLRLPQPRLLFWLDVTYFGVVLVPIGLLIFAMQFTGRGFAITIGRLALLCLVPALTLIFLWTDPLHGLFYGGVHRPPYQGVIYSGGPWFYISVAYSYGLVLIAFFFLLLKFLSSRFLYRQQMAAVLTGAAIPLLVNVFSLLGYSPFPNLDLTPLAFTVTGAFFAIALYRLGLLDIVPVARHTLVEEMNDGLLVLDAQNRIVDINPAAQAFLNLGGEPPIGESAYEVFAPWPDLRERFADTREAREEVKLTILGTDERTVDLRISPLMGGSDSYNGRLFLFRDISERVHIEAQLRRANRRLQKQLTEIEALQTLLREQAIRDPLTGLFNRRFLEESLPREISQAQREGDSLSIAMVDIDGFKSFNDTYGHTAGDNMLQALAGILIENTRGGDILCRYGGEEFVVVLPGASLETALMRIDACRQAFENKRLRHQGEVLATTLSAGVAAYPLHGSSTHDLLDAADKAMYWAKQQGRNQVLAFEKTA